MYSLEKIILTPDQERWLRRHFMHTKNDVIVAKFGWSQSTLHRFARRLGLKKSPQFMRKVQRAAVELAHESNLKNGTYPPKGYIIPRSEEFRFRTGEKMAKRFGKRVEKKRIEKAAASRAKTFKEEKARATWGLPQRTKLNVICQPKHTIQQRSYLRKLGYIIERGSTIAYYGPDTVRSEYYENSGRDKKGRCIAFRFLPLPEAGAMSGTENAAKASVI